MDGSDLFHRRVRSHAPSPLFIIPLELRLQIYELVFTSPPPSAEPAPLPSSAANLRPLLTCRKFYEEARKVAYACTTHNLRAARAPTFLRRLWLHQPKHLSNLCHIAFHTTSAHFYDQLQPLRNHLDRRKDPFISLKSLTIVLDVPDTVLLMDRLKRLREQDMLFATLYYLKNVDKVVVLNVLHKEDIIKGQLGAHGEWTCLNVDKPLPTSADDPFVEATLLDNIRWRVELTDFFDYSWKPWFE